MAGARSCWTGGVVYRHVLSSLVSAAGIPRHFLRRRLLIARAQKLGAAANRGLACLWRASILIGLDKSAVESSRVDVGCA